MIYYLAQHMFHFKNDCIDIIIENFKKYRFEIFNICFLCNNLLYTVTAYIKYVCSDFLAYSLRGMILLC